MHIQFYHLLATPLDRALPKLLEKAYAGGFRALVLTESEERAEHLSNLLWAYDQDSFLPHGTARDGHQDRQPVYLAARQENPNNANLLMVTDGSQPEDLSGFERVLDIFDGRDATAAANARARWKTYKAAGFDLSYIRQNERGGWDKAAE